jgi:hypothetical protein
MRQSKLTEFKKKVVPGVKKISAIRDPPLPPMPPNDLNFNARLDRIESMCEAILINQQSGGLITSGTTTITVEEKTIKTMRIEQAPTVPILANINQSSELKEKLRKWYVEQ